MSAPTRVLNVILCKPCPALFDGEQMSLNAILHDLHEISERDLRSDVDHGSEGGRAPLDYTPRA
jgi:5'-deoxynucleotidase YfbR-like HD superfamily hydrolase